MTAAAAIARGFLEEISKLAAKLREPAPSKLVDGLCEVFDKEKPRTPMQKAQELTDRRTIDEIRKNPQNQVMKSHAHLVHSDPGMTTPGM